jgi:ribosome-binding factor A
MLEFDYDESVDRAMRISRLMEEGSDHVQDEEN